MLVRLLDPPVHVSSLCGRLCKSQCVREAGGPKPTCATKGRRLVRARTPSLRPRREVPGRRPAGTPGVRGARAGVPYSVPYPVRGGQAPREALVCLLARLGETPRPSCLRYGPARGSRAAGARERSLRRRSGAGNTAGDRCVRDA